MKRVEYIIGNAKPVFTTSTGVKLYTDNELAKDLNKDLTELNLTKVQAFLTLHPNKEITLLLIENGKPIFESPRVEDVSCYIQALYLSSKKA